MFSGFGKGKKRGKGNGKEKGRKKEAGRRRRTYESVTTADYLVQFLQPFFSFLHGEGWRDLFEFGFVFGFLGGGCAGHLPAAEPVVVG